MSTQEIQVPSRNGDAPIASQKRKRNRKSQTGISTASVEVEEAVEQVDETPQKRRRVGRKNEKSTSDTAPNGEKSPSRHLENGIANAEDESPILASSLLKTMKAKRKKGPIAGNLNDIPPEDDQLSYNNSNSLDVPNLAGKSTSDHTDRVESEESTSKPSNDEDRSPNDAEGLPVVEPESTAETDNAPLTESEERVANARYVEDEEMEEANGDVLGAGVQNVSDVEMERAENDIVLRNDEQHNTNTPKTSKKERKKKRKAATVDENEEDERTSVPKPRKLRKQGSKANVVEEENAEHEVVPTPKKSKKKRTSNQDSKQPISELPVADMDLSSPEKTRPTRRGHTRGAQEELDVEHTIFGEPNTKESGDFTSDEAELLRREIKRYQFNNDLAVDDLVRLIQWTAPYGKNQDVDETTARQVMCSRLFWRDIYDILPKRKHSKAKGGTTGIQRYVRRNYHNFKGAGKWTPEEDKLLKELCVAHPNQWTKISALIGDRDTTACRDRWRNYLQYGDSRNSSVWSEKEEQKLMETVANFIETLRETREDAERPSIEEYTSRDINWQLVSEVVGTRSRLQCSEKWKALLAREERSSAPVNTPNARKRKSPKKKAPKSDYMVDEDSHEATPLRATSKGKPTKTTPRTSSRRTMLWGDKLDVIEDIMSFDFQSLEEVDWREVDQQALGSNWSIQDRKKVLSELLDEVGEQESFLDALGAICVYMQEHHGDELQQRYDPFVVSEAEYEEDNALMATAAQASNMGKKRKQRSDAGKLRTPNKTKTSRTPSKKYTSNYFVTESDDDS
jgi:hypothetical protein